jgi:hypothetical protein
MSGNSLPNLSVVWEFDPEEDGDDLSKGEIDERRV